MYPRLLAQTSLPIQNPSINSLIGTFYNFRNGPAAVQRILRVILDALFVAAGVYFFINILLGGYSFITAGGDKEAVQKAQKRIVNSLVGIIIVFSVFAILFVVETLFGVNLRNPNIPNI